MLREKTLYKPFLIAWNLTRQCNLHCRHCYIDAGEFTRPSFPELSREEGFSLIDDIAAVNPGTILVLTGGEPLLYSNTLDFAGYASNRGLMVVVGTNGLLLDDAMVRRLLKIGVSGVGLSLDSLDPLLHDSFRGYPGAWKRVVEAIESCRSHGLPFQIHFSVMSFNWKEVPQIVEFAHLHGARVVNFFFMVCTGRGEKLTDITPEQYEEVLSTLIDLQERYPGMMIRARCAPHYKRIAYQKDPHSQVTKAEGYLGGGCLAGTHYCRIAPDGEITPCPYMTLPVGNVRNNKFSEIWESAAAFLELRAPKLKGKCGECEFEELCGGCRARPYASHEDYLDEDLWCLYKPAGGVKIGAAKMSEDISMRWTEEAEERITRLPFFLRNMIRGNVEKYAKEQGISSITPELLDELRKKRFGDKDVPPIDRGDIPVPLKEGFPGEKSDRSLPWTKEALRRLDAIPEFMQGMFKDVAEEFAKGKGHLEVNVEVWDRLEEISGEKLEVRREKLEVGSKRSEVRTECESEKEMEWSEDALLEIGERYSGKPVFVRDFMIGIIKEDVETFARSRGVSCIDREVLRAAAGDEKVKAEWSEEAWARLQKAPDFIRSGIRKAAERKAARMGVPQITSELLTQFRNTAMMKAVKRIKTLGYHDLTFDAFDFAKENFKHIRDNVEAQERLDEIKEYVTSKGKIGLMDEEMLSKMKEILRK